MAKGEGDKGRGDKGKGDSRKIRALETERWERQSLGRQRV